MPSKPRATKAKKTDGGKKGLEQKQHQSFLTKSVFNDQKAGMEHIVTSLTKNPSGLKELELYGRFDPNMITRLLEVLVKRGAVEMSILEDQVGASRRKYVLRTG